jgi:hypothetical protein
MLVACTPRCPPSPEQPHHKDPGPSRAATLDSAPLSRVTLAEHPEGVTAVAPLRRSTGGTSGAFLIRADDGRRYWCKTLNNLQGPRVPANEQLAGRLGSLIGAPVCEPSLVRIPHALAGWEFKEGTGRRLEPGWAHGSVAVDPAVETRDLASRGANENARRHAGIYALHDWLGGSDAQWLMVGGDNAFYSHDHGHYFPNGPAWTTSSLQQAAASAFPLGFPSTGLDPAELARLADRLNDLTEEEVVAAMSNLPAEWPVQEDELEALFDFVYGRRSAVAQRLRTLVAV